MVAERPRSSSACSCRPTLPRSCLRATAADKRFHDAPDEPTTHDHRLSANLPASFRAGVGARTARADHVTTPGNDRHDQAQRVGAKRRPRATVTASISASRGELQHRARIQLFTAGGPLDIDVSGPGAVHPGAGPPAHSTGRLLPPPPLWDLSGWPRCWRSASGAWLSRRRAQHGRVGRAAARRQAAASAARPRRASTSGVIRKKLI